MADPLCDSPDRPASEAPDEPRQGPPTPDGPPNGGDVPPDDLTALLGRIARDKDARDVAFRVVYRDLHRIANAQLRRSGEGSVQPTDLLHSAYLRLVRTPQDFRGRQHFFAVAALAMKQALIDHLRQRQRRPTTEDARGGEGSHDESDVEAGTSYLDRVAMSFEERGIALLDLDLALTALETTDPQAAQLAILVLFGGFSRSDAAELLGLSARTGDRVWAFARARLERALAAYRPPAGRPAPDPRASDDRAPGPHSDDPRGRR